MKKKSFNVELYCSFIFFHILFLLRNIISSVKVHSFKHKINSEIRMNINNKNKAHVSMSNNSYKVYSI